MAGSFVELLTSQQKEQRAILFNVRESRFRARTLVDNF